MKKKETVITILPISDLILSRTEEVHRDKCQAKVVYNVQKINTHYYYCCFDFS